MALFPSAKFEVLLPGGIVTPGRRLEAELVVINAEPIARAEHVSLVFNSTAWAGYGSGKSRSVVTRTIFLAPLNSDLPGGELPPGDHRYPFLIEIPEWLPPAYSGNDCGIVHRLEARLDVDWAIDPTASLVPTVAMPPRQAARTPRSTRSPVGFHDTIVLEVLLDSTTVTQDEPLRGQVALRSGHDARFDAVDLCLASVAHVPMGRGDRRRNGGQTIHVPAASLRSGEPVPFVFPPAAYQFPPSFQDGFLDHQVGLFVSVDIPWAIDPSFEIAIEMLPHGSTLIGGAAEGAVGSERLRRVSMAMAQASGLRQGLPPVLVDGAQGPVSLRLVDSARGGNIGVLVEMTYPEVELGIRFRPLGVLEGFRESPLLPAGLRDQYLLRAEPEAGRSPVADADLQAFFGAVLAELGKPDEVRLSDHHFALHYTLPNDEVERMTEIARFARSRAESLADAIARLPFPPELSASRAAWQAVAAEQSATLVPTGPAIHGVAMRARVVGGEERGLVAAIRTITTKKGPRTRVEVDLRGAPLPKPARAELEAEAPIDRVRPVRAVFPEAHVLGDGATVTLERDGFTQDPRALLSALETFLWWVLEVRGERRADAPYR